MKKLSIFIIILSFFGINLNIFGLNLAKKVETSSNSSTEIKIKNISSNLWATYFLDENGTVWGEGDNNWGIFGQTESSFISKPIIIMKDVKEVFPRGFSTLFLKKDKTLWVVGGNNYGDCGVGDVYSIENPTQIMSNVEKIFWEDSVLMILTEDTTLWAAGSNHYYKLGIGYNDKASIPTKVAKNVTNVIFGDECTMIIKEDGTLLGMGTNSTGELGTGDNKEMPFPTVITSDVENVYLDRAVSFFLKKDGTLWKTPYIYSEKIINSKKPLIKVTENILDISSYYGSLIFLKTDNSLWKEKDESDFNKENSSIEGFVKILDNVERINPYIYKDNKELFFCYPQESNYKLTFKEDKDRYELGDYILKKNGELFFSDNKKLITDKVKDITISNDSLFVLKENGTVWKKKYDSKSTTLKQVIF